MKKDLVLTFITQIIVLVAGLYTYRLAKVRFSETVFADYALIKRNTSFLFSFFFFGLTVAIPRYVSISINKRKGSEGTILFFSSLFIGGIVLVILLLGTLLEKEIAFLLFGDENFSRYIFPFLLMLTGMLFHSIPYSFFRGKLEMVKANSLQLVNYAIVPVTVFLLGSSLKQALFINGIVWWCVSIPVIFYILISYRKNFYPYKEFLIETWKNGKILIAYGIQRIPADFGLAALLSLPPIIVAHRFSTVYGGYTAFSVSLVRMIGALFAPVGIVLLPKFTSLITGGEIGKIKKYVGYLSIFTFFVSITGIVIYFRIDSLLLKIYLGSFKKELVYFTEIFIAASIGYNLFVSLRSFIDAVYFFSVNTINIAISLIIMVILIFIIWNTNNNVTITLLLLSIPFYILGILTLIVSWKTIVKIREGNVRVK